MKAHSHDRPLRILEILEPSGGGSGRHFVDLSLSLSERGHEICAIYSPLRAEERFVEELKSLPILSIHSVNMTRSPSPSDFTAWRQINQIAASEGPFDIIHGHSSKAGALMRLRLPGRHVPRVYTPHAFRTMDPLIGDNGRRIFGGIESLLGKHLTDALICVSQDEYTHAARYLGIPESILHVVVNGAAPPPGGRRDEMRDRLGVGRNSFVFGFVGRLCEQKAPERLISAFAAIARHVAWAELVMIGFGQQEETVRQQIDASGFADRVHLTSDITGPEAMQTFDTLVMPSRYEAMSYVMLEAAASGLPMILSDVGGAGVVLQHGRNGFMVANSDETSELAAAMLELTQPACYAQMLSGALAGKGLHSLSRMTDEIEAIYRSLIGHN